MIVLLVLLDYSLIIANNQWLISSLSINYPLITYWCCWSSISYVLLSENCSLLGTDTDRGQVSEHISLPNGGHCLYIWLRISIHKCDVTFLLQKLSRKARCGDKHKTLTGCLSFRHFGINMKTLQSFLLEVKTNRS